MNGKDTTITRIPVIAVPASVPKIDQDNPFEQSDKERTAVEFKKLPSGKITVRLRSRGDGQADWWLLSLSYELHGGVSEPQEGSYAHDIASQMQCLEELISQGQPLGSLLERAVALGGLIAEARLHGELERATWQAKKQKIGSRKGARARHGETPMAERIAQRCASYDRHNLPDRALEEVERLAAKECGVTTKTIRNALLARRRK